MIVNEQLSDPMITVTMNDLMGAVLAAEKGSSGMTNLTDTMKQELIAGMRTMKTYLAEAAYKYYSDVDFEDTSENVTLMRDVVQCYVESGGKL